MKKVTTVLFVLAGLVMLIRCANEEDKTIEAEAQKESELHTEIKDELHLNNGEKWKVNEEMKPFIDDAEQLLHTYIKNEDKDFEKLALSLEEQNNQLIKSCTMKGEAHEKLHNWLLPHIQLISNLKNAENQAESEIVIQKLEQSFIIYKNYFQ